MARGVKRKPPRSRYGKLPAGALETIPGIGVSLARDLRALGYRRVEDLRGADPEAMYHRLCHQTGTHQDPCVLYTFRCAVYYATRQRPSPRLLQWWNWKGRRLPR
jgi:hypothetical protein